MQLYIIIIPSKQEFVTPCIRPRNNVQELA